MSDDDTLFTIGEVAKRTGLSVRTIRFWSDSGLVSAPARSAAGYRLYDAEAVARLDLVATLRELGIGHEAIRAVLRRQTSLAGIAAAHVRALDAEIRTLTVRRAVLHSVAHRRSSTEEMRIMHKMAQLSAAERQRLLDEFVDETFAGVESNESGATIAAGMRTLPAELPERPTAEQLEAWVELTELIADEDFRLRVRQMAVAGAGGAHEHWVNPAAVAEHVPAAMAAGVAPESADGRQVLHRIIDPDMASEDRVRLADEIARFADRRVERYWRLLGVLNDWPPRPGAPTMPQFEWLIAALRAEQGS